MYNSRTKKFALNTVSSLFLQIVTIVCGFILPRLFLQTYGSEINGLVSSISQFLGVISFLEMGVGAVVRFNLYKPLADNDEAQISKVIKSANKFFTRLALILLCYVLVLIIFYPMFAAKQFGHIYTALLILSMCISLFAQYFFGQVNQLLLTADQKGYIQYGMQILTLILNTAACAVLINLGFGIHIVKLTTSLIYLIRPLFLQIYVKKHYNIDRKIKYDEEPIKQKWNGLAQHISAVILDGTDIIVLTLFSTLSNVSIYYAYNLVVNGTKQLVFSMTNGIQSVLGELIAKNQKEELIKTFNASEWSIHTITTYIFGCTAMLILPFISVYTKGINDADYYIPLFALLITFANAGHCLRLPYNLMIQAAGHYKQTQNNFIIAAAMNIIISVILVVFKGLIGVAIGTLFAMLYQTIWMAWYNSKNIIAIPFMQFWKQFALDIITIVLIRICTSGFTLQSLTYASWVILACKVALISAVIVIAVNMIFKREYLIVFLNKILYKKRER